MTRSMSSRCATTASSVRSQFPMKTGWCVSWRLSMLARLDGSRLSFFSSSPGRVAGLDAPPMTDPPPPKSENFFFGGALDWALEATLPSAASIRTAAFLVSFTGAASSRPWSSTSMVRVTVNTFPSGVSSSSAGGPENQLATMVAEEPSGREAVESTERGTWCLGSVTSTPLTSSTLEIHTRMHRSTGYFCACPCESLMSTRRARPCLSVYTPFVMPKALTPPSY
mmetsp:Transcript_4341/g.12241  ORF Transcript_4341/g.12241 Transcript_4341/m.12241 type:complete len:225 (-) Transcript_4341:325-999(-)